MGRLAGVSSALLSAGILAKIIRLIFSHTPKTAAKAACRAHTTEDVTSFNRCCVHPGSTVAQMFNLPEWPECKGSRRVTMWIRLTILRSPRAWFVPPPDG